MGVYYLKQGDAAAAVKAFGDTKSNNAALAQILTKDYSKAKSTLAAIDRPDATTYYLHGSTRRSHKQRVDAQHKPSSGNPSRQLTCKTCS